MKEDNMMDTIWDLISVTGGTRDLICLADYMEPSVDQYDTLVKEGPFEVMLFHANLSMDPLCVLQAMITCKQ